MESAKQKANAPAQQQPSSERKERPDGGLERGDVMGQHSDNVRMSATVSTMQTSRQDFSFKVLECSKTPGNVGKGNVVADEILSNCVEKHELKAMLDQATGGHGLCQCRGVDDATSGSKRKAAHLTSHAAASSVSRAWDGCGCVGMCSLECPGSRGGTDKEAATSAGAFGAPAAYFREGAVCKGFGESSQENPLPGL